MALGGPWVLLLWLMLAGAPTAQAHQPVVVEPDWAAPMREEDLISAYPPEALKQGHEGRVLLHCRVHHDGSLSDCQVTQETPPGEGFGEAALKLQPKIKMKPKTVDGQAVDDGEVEIPLNFKMVGASLDTPRGLALSETCLAIAAHDLDVKDPKASFAYRLSVYNFTYAAGIAGYGAQAIFDQIGHAREAGETLLKTTGAKDDIGMCRQLFATAIAAGKAH